MRDLDDRTLTLDGVAADLRQAVRSLRASPTFTIGALLVLAAICLE